MAIMFTVAPFPGIMEAMWHEEVLGQSLGHGERRYTYDDWVVTVEYPIIPKPDYEVSIVHEGLEIDWLGAIKADGSLDGPILEKFIGLSPIMMITFTPIAMENKIVTLVGEYRGWRSEGGEPPPITKSDWVLNDKTGEIYVTGVVPDLDPVDDIGELVTVTGLVKIADEMPYFKAVHVQRGAYMGLAPR